MPKILPSVLYTDGVLLDVDGHNRNVYDPVPGRGLMSEQNGGLDTTNLQNPGFQIQPEHIMPQTAIRTNTEFMLSPIDCFQDVFGADVKHSDYNYNTAPNHLWTSVPGCGLRFYLPHEARCLLQWSFFAHPFHVARHATEGDDDTLAFDMATAMKLDGEVQATTRRPFPLTARYKVDSPGWVEDVAGTHYSERRTAQWWDMHLVRYLAAGVHDLQLSMYMESVQMDRNSADASTSGTKGHVVLERQRYGFDPDLKTYGLIGKRDLHLLFQRATFGVRSALVLALR